MTKFNLNAARLMLNLAIEAGKSEDDIDIENYDMELISYIEDGKTDTQLYICRDIDRLIIAFRGTENFNDILTDLSIGKKSFPPTRRWFFKPKVHAGFFKAYQAVAYDIVSTIRKLLKENDYYIYLTGHSLGGGLATIAAVDLKRKFKEADITVFTYGSPRVGNRWFKRHYNRHLKKSYRVVNDDDVVPQLPGQSTGYHHVDTYVMIDEEERIIINPSVSKRIEKDIEGWTSTLSQGIEEHRIVYYQKLLSEVNDVIVEE